MIRLNNVSFTYQDGTKALRDLNLQIEEGETVLVLGPNDSGKSTLARHLNGLLLPSSGEVLVDGVSTKSDELNARLQVGLVFQNPENQIVGNTVRDDIAFGPENLGLKISEIQKRVEKSLDILDLSELKDKSPHLLSDGQKKRVAIAGALAMQPATLALDDPFSGLDLPSISSLYSHLVELKERGYTIVAFSHKADRIWRIADRLIIINKGRICNRGQPSEFFLEGLNQYGVAEPHAWKALRLIIGDIDLIELFQGDY